MKIHASYFLWSWREQQGSAESSLLQGHHRLFWEATQPGGLPPSTQVGQGGDLVPSAILHFADDRLNSLQRGNYLNNDNFSFCCDLKELAENKSV